MEEPDLDRLTADEWQRWYDSLASLDRNLSNAPASARAFAWIWKQCRGEVTENLRLYLPRLAARFGKSIKTAQYWLDYLEDKGLLWVRNRTLKTRPPEGWVLLDVYHPNPELRDRPVRVDPQQWFPFMDEGPAGPPIVARPARSSGAQSLPANTDPCLPANSARRFGKHRKRPCKDAVLEAVRSGQVSMGQGLALLCQGETPARAPPPKRAASSRVRDLISKSKQKFKSEISGAGAQQDQKAVEVRIVQAIGDPELRPQPVRKVARKIADGELDWEDVQRVIDNARQCFRDGNVDAPWIYWVGAMRKLFEERGWQWRARKGPRA